MFLQYQCHPEPPRSRRVEGLSPNIFIVNRTHYKRSIVWLRRDLRLRDNVALYEACRRSERVCLAFVVHPPLLAEDRMGAPLVTVFFHALRSLREDLRGRGSDLAILTGDFAQELHALAARIDAEAVFYNEDYEPGAIARDAVVTATLENAGIDVHASLDHVYFGADDVLRNDGSVYRMFTPYKRRWLDQRALSARAPVPSEDRVRDRLMRREAIGDSCEVPTPADFGFQTLDAAPPTSESAALERLDEFMESGTVERYREDREFPAIDGTSRLSVHLRAGTIGIRTCVETAFNEHHADTWISELIWRDFYQMILKKFPHVVDAPFQKAASTIAWEKPDGHFEAWSEGRTGYPIVDAAMRQLNTTGWMHNRLRMIVASFLTKHLLIDWRVGERYFERHLIDADVAQNNGGWQWAASTGTDAAPYFRIFNPTAQSRKFDPEGTFIKRFVPELEPVPAKYIHEPLGMPPMLQATLNVTIGNDYPLPIVDHAKARERALKVYGAALGKRASR